MEELYEVVNMFWLYGVLMKHGERTNEAETKALVAEARSQNESVLTVAKTVTGPSISLKDSAILKVCKNETEGVRGDANCTNIYDVDTVITCELGKIPLPDLRVNFEV